MTAWEDAKGSEACWAAAPGGGSTAPAVSRCGGVRQQCAGIPPREEGERRGGLRRSRRRLCLRFARVRGVGNRGVVAGGDWGRFFLRGGVRQRREVWSEEHDGVGSVRGRPRWCAPAAGRRGAREKRMSEAESLRGGEKGGTVGVIALGWDGRMR